MEPLPKFRLYIFTRIIRLKVLIVCNKDKLFLFRITYYIDPIFWRNKYSKMACLYQSGLSCRLGPNYVDISRSQPPDPCQQKPNTPAENCNCHLRNYHFLLFNTVTAFFKWKKIIIKTIHQNRVWWNHGLILKSFAECILFCLCLVWYFLFFYWVLGDDSQFVNRIHWNIKMCVI